MKLSVCTSCIAALVLCFTEPIHAQVPENFNWQGVIRDSQGEILQSSAITVRFEIEYEIFQNMFAPVYVEDHEVSTNEFGLVNLKIGTGTEVAGDFDLVDWRSDYRLTVKLNTGSGFVEMSSDYFSTVPFAMRARDNWALNGNNNLDPEHYIGTTDNVGIRFKTDGQDRMFLDENGKVGIGTIDPGATLDIFNNSGTTDASIALNYGLPGATDATSSVIKQDATSLSINNLAIQSCIKLIPRESLYSIYYSEPGMIVNYGPEVGIGLYDPDWIRCSLHVGVGSDASLTGYDSGFLLMGDVNGSNMVLDQNEILARNNGGTNTLFLNTSGGAVVINQNTTPGFDFAVNGTAAKPGGGSWSALSDARMKENVQSFASGLEIIRAVKPVSFHYNHRSGFDTEVKHVGVIAQELQEVAPFMVEEKTMEFESGEKEDYLTVDPSAFTYLLINAVKELEMQNESQSKIIDDLARQNQELLKRIEALEKK
jgi:hypothetical protein